MKEILLNCTDKKVIKN